MIAQANIRNALTEIARDNIKVNMDPRIIKAKIKIFNKEALTAEETLLINHQYELIFRTAENVYYQYDAGTFNHEEFVGYRDFFRTFYSEPMVMQAWNNSKMNYSSDFRKNIEHLLTN